MDGKGFMMFGQNFANTISTSDVESSIMWGSEYDHMLNWMSESGVDIFESRMNGGFNNSNITGFSEEDVANNIFDLWGGLDEFTMEVAASESDQAVWYRLFRGCCYKGYMNAGHNIIYNKDTTLITSSERNSWHGARLALTLK